MPGNLPSQNQTPARERPLALVTGGGRGIGRAIVSELARTHQVVATYRADQASAESLRAETGADVVQSDVASVADRATLMNHVRGKYAGVDLLVNNAGVGPRERRDVLEADVDSFDELLAVNLKGPHFLTQQIARWMLERGRGRIVFITSISSYAVSVNRAGYCVSKAGLSMSAAVYAARLAPQGIPVFEIRPGIIRTDMIAAVAQTYEERIAGGLLPQRRMGEPRDVAMVVRAIADGLLDYSTGQVIEAGGGFGLRVL